MGFLRESKLFSSSGEIKTAGAPSGAKPVVAYSPRQCHNPDISLKQEAWRTAFPNVSLSFHNILFMIYFL